MRRVLTALAALSLAAALIPQSAEAQSGGRPGGQQSREQSPDQGTSQRSRQVRIALVAELASGHELLPVGSAHQFNFIKK